jgi:hypothetical protein
MKKLVDRDGNLVEKGKEYFTFRNEPVTVLGWSEPHKPSSTGRVYTSLGEFFPGVIGAKFVEVH